MQSIPDVKEQSYQLQEQIMNKTGHSHCGAPSKLSSMPSFLEQPIPLPYDITC